MSSSLFRSLIRRRQSALAANMSHPRLIGSVSHQDGLTDKISDTKFKAHNGDGQMNSDTQVKLVTTFSVEGLQASQIQTLICLLQQHLNAGGVHKAMVKHLNSQLPLPEKFRVRFQVEAGLKGFEKSDFKALLPSAENFTTTALEFDRGTKLNKNINFVKNSYSQAAKDSTGPIHIGCYSEARLKSSDDYGS